MIAIFINRIRQKIHVANNINKFFEDRHIQRLSWRKAPDLNLMESVWAFVKGKLKGSYRSQDELEEDIVFYGKIYLLNLLKIWMIVLLSVFKQLLIPNVAD